MNTTAISQRRQAKILRIERREERLLWLAYGCYALAVLMPVGVILNLIEVWRFRRAAGVKREGMQIADGHHRWLLITALVTFFATLASLGTFYYGVGAILALATVGWWGYRVVRGMMALSHHTAPA